MTDSTNHREINRKLQILTEQKLLTEVLIGDVDTELRSFRVRLEKLRNACKKTDDPEEKAKLMIRARDEYVTYQKRLAAITGQGEALNE